MTATSHTDHAHKKQKFTWTPMYSKITLLGLIGFLVIGGGFTAVSLVQTSKEKSVQTELFKIEKSYNEKKQNFAEAENPPAPRDPKDKTPAPEPKAKATGDMTQDYGAVVAEFETFLGKHKGTKAAQMAALHLSEIYRKHQKPELSEAALNQAVSEPKNLISALVSVELGKALADQKKCEQAINTWDKVLNQKTVGFMHSTVMLQQGLCLESLGQAEQAESKYRAAKDLDPQGAGRHADQLIRLLRAQASL